MSGARRLFTAFIAALLATRDKNSGGRLRSIVPYRLKGDTVGCHCRWYGLTSTKEQASGTSTKCYHHSMGSLRTFLVPVVLLVCLTGSPAWADETPLPRVGRVAAADGAVA